VLAILGPSGAGKTTLINVLTLNAFGGVSKGYVALNGSPITPYSFIRDCYVVSQQDFHWSVTRASFQGHTFVLRFWTAP
jgi:ABC-type multidrug transport system ATPase subunit